LCQHDGTLVDLLPFVCQIESNGNVVTEVGKPFSLENDFQNYYKLVVVFLLHLDYTPLYFVDNAFNPAMFLRATWASLTNAFVASTTPLALTPNY
jgi:hypothetical protein